MKSRIHLDPRAREACSRILKLIDHEPFIQGKWVVMPKLCGKSACHCIKGERHISHYISLKYKGKRKMIYIPEGLEEEAKKHVCTFADLKKFLQAASDSYMDRLLKAKKNSAA